MTTTRNDIIKYFKKIRCDFLSTHALSSDECLVHLSKIFMAHIHFFPFHNFELRKASQEHPLYRKNLTLFKMQQFVAGQHGGFCFQSTQILYEALKNSDFDVYCSIAKVLNGLAPDSIEASKIPATHLVLIVNIDNQKYLLDPSMAMNGHCAPLLLSESPRSYTQNNRHFKIEKINDYYLFHREIHGKWSSAFCSSLLPASLVTIQTQLTKLQCFPDILGIRDMITLVGIGAPLGGKSLLWSSITNSFVFKIISTKEDLEKEVKMDADEAFALLPTEFNIQNVSKIQFKEYCSTRLWPKLKGSIEVSFPIDEKERSTLQKRFR